MVVWLEVKNFAPYFPGDCYRTAADCRDTVLFWLRRRQRGSMARCSLILRGIVTQLFLTTQERDSPSQTRPLRRGNSSRLAVCAQRLHLFSIS